MCAESPDALAVAKHATCRSSSTACSASDDGAFELDADGGRPRTSRGGRENLEVGKSGRVAFDVFHQRRARSSASRRCSSGATTSRNCVAAIAVAHARGVPIKDIQRGVASFAGVRRRQELRGIAGGVTVLDDYAHHPTAVRETLKALRKRFPKRRLIAVYEPRSATSRRKTFQAEFADAFAHADEVDRRPAVRSVEDPAPTIASIPSGSRSICTAAAPRRATRPTSTRS